MLRVVSGGEGLKVGKKFSSEQFLRPGMRNACKCDRSNGKVLSAVAASVQQLLAFLSAC